MTDISIEEARKRAKVNGASRCEESEVSELSPSWPDPLAPAVFHGLAGEVVRAIEPHTEADPAAILLQFLATFGAACGRESYVQVESDRHPPQIWPVMAGETAKGRKGTSWGRVRRLIEMASPHFTAERIVSGLSSGEGLIWAVRDPITKTTKNKDTGDYEDLELDAGVIDKRLLVLEAEFASPLRHIERSGNTLSSTMRSFWDTGAVASLTKNSPAKTTGSIAMAGDKIIMPSNSFMMVHNPLGFTMGDAADHAEMVELLEKIGGSLVGIYAARTGRGEDEIQAIMGAETWFTAEEAVAAGFADEIEEPLKVAASVDPARFRNAPAELTARASKTSPDEIAEREQAAQICRLCAAADDMALATSAIESGLSVADVEALLQDRAAERDALDDKLAKVRGDRTKGQRAQEDIAASWDRAIAAISRGQS